MSDASALLAAALADRYIVERPIGAGGMATVYLARDLRHDRQVALKVLRPELAAAVGVDRFLAEIRVTARLQHPNLLPLFDSGQVHLTPAGERAAEMGFGSTLLYYVMPYVDGESLRARLDRETQMPLEDAIHIASAVAGALDYAHRQQIIHRDLKPENILLKEGEPLVADFGIALAVSHASEGRITQTGFSVGTPRYMSPEQAAGDRTVDGRTDVYALGAVLYEMLTGEPPHSARSTQAEIAKILMERPASVRTLRPSVPEHVAAAVEKALEKVPADRWSSAKDFADALKDSASTTLSRPIAAATTPASAPPRRWWASPLPWAAAFVVMTAFAAWVATHNSRSASGGSVRFPLTFPPNERIASTAGSTVAFSPDGRVIAYSGIGTGGLQQLFLRAVDEISARPVAGTVDAEQPFFSPDGSHIGYVARGILNTIPVSGGTPLALAAAGLANGASWAGSGATGPIVISIDDRLAVVSEGHQRPLGALDSAAGERGQRWPRVLEDGKTILYTSWRTGIDNARIAITSLDDGRTTILPLSGTFPLGVIDGQMIYSSVNGSLMAVALDLRSRRLIGTPHVVVDKVFLRPEGPASAALSSNGSLIYQIGKARMQLVVAGANGVERTLIGDPGQYAFPRLSPDGARIALSVSSDSMSNVWISDVRTGRLRALTNGGTFNDRPEWTPDGRSIVFSSNRSGGYALWIEPADGSAPARLLLALPGTPLLEGVISPDGHRLVYRTGNQDIFVRRLDGDTTPRAIAASPSPEFAPRLSRDGKWVAYSVEESGVAQVFVRSFPDLGPAHQVSVDGGTEPVWSADGRRLFYRRNRVINAATLETTPTWRVTSRQELLEADFVFQAVHAEYDVWPSGGAPRFVVLKSAGSDVQTIVVQNWRAELRPR